MRHSTILLLTLMATLALSSCKTNERNMMDAYEKAIAGKAELEAEEAKDASIYGNVRREMKHDALIVNGDTLDVSVQWVRLTKDGGGINEYLKRYCVVVGQFKQRFNAKSMRERLTENGYPGCFVVETREPYFFVIAASYDELDPAIEMLHKVEKDPVFRFKSPVPFILRPAQIPK